MAQQPTKYVGIESSDEEDSEDEENETYSRYVESTFQHYKKVTGENDYTDDSRAKHQILESRHSRCLICLEKVRANDPIWQCAQCCCILHLICIQSWIKNRVPEKNNTFSEELFPGRKESLPWQCPKCRQMYKREEAPTQYRCFCNKVVDPPFDAWQTPHSCGQICGKRLKPECGHTCTLLCHPDHCPPCPQTVRTSCYCGRVVETRRCAQKTFQCTNICNRVLNCGHKCDSLCHSGDCPPCQKESLQYCLCRRTQQRRKCAELKFQCEAICNKSLECGKHKCQRRCHEGLCGDCELSLPRKCPCGKKVWKLPCDQNTPTCGDTCGKLLSCGQHHCNERCHRGECSPCILKVRKRCRCGQMTREAQCSKEFTCDKKCSKNRNCGRHLCKKKCCVGNCPPCEETCNRKLKCGNHVCQSFCHEGPCLPCPLTVVIKCACESSVITVPCGAERNVKPPRCNRPCQIPPLCHHPERKRHRCHFNPCPPCRFMCQVPHRDCAGGECHPCPLQCHDPVPLYPWKTYPPTVYTKKNKAPPIPPPISEDQVLCPPCMFAVNRQCLGKHETVEVPCSSPTSYSCKRRCNNVLNCGNHYCRQRSSLLKIVTDAQGAQHVVAESEDTSDQKDTCELCTAPCSKEREPPCKHPCPLPCHLNRCPPCEVPIRIPCHCNSVKKYIPCHQTHNKLLMNTLLECGQECQKPLPNCNHMCTQLCHPNDCTMQCKKKVPVTCPCKRQKQNWICLQAQEVRKAQNIGHKDPIRSLILLRCDEECQKIKQERKQQLHQQQEQLQQKVASSAVISETQTFTKRKKRRQITPIEEKKQKCSIDMVIVIILVLLACCLVHVYFLLD